MRGVYRRPVASREIVVHRCRGCGREWATYRGELPRGWRIDAGGRLWCGARSAQHGDCRPVGAREVR